MFSIVRVRGQVSLSVVARGDKFQVLNNEPSLTCDRTEGESVLLLDCHISEFTQINRGNATGFQTLITGGSVTFVGMAGGEEIANKPPAITLVVPAGWQGQVRIQPNSVVALNTSQAVIVANE